MSTVVVALYALGTLAGSQAVQAQNHEIGTLVGITTVTRSGTSVIYIGIPGDGIQALPTLYATFLTNAHVLVEPQLVFTRISSGGSAVTSIGLAGRLGYLPAPSKTGSPYLAADIAYQSVSSGRSISGPGAGGAIGYRFKIKNSLALRVDARYRRWFSDFKGLNEFGFGVGFGALF
jgi:hypothetical protein